MRRAKLKSAKSLKIKPTTILSLVLLTICFFCWIFLNQFNKKVTPKLIEIATLNIDKLTYNIFNDYTMMAEMDDELVANLLTITKNQKDEIINISYNTKNAYKIASILAERIKKDYISIENGNKKLEYYDEELSNIEDGLVLTLPIGIVSDKVYLANLGPRIPVKIKFVGTLLTNLKTKVQNYGINNALIELYIDVSITHEIITPVTFQNKELKYEILIGAQVINGAVPSYYGGLFETKSNILNVPIN